MVCTAVQVSLVLGHPTAGSTEMITREKKRYILDQSLESLNGVLDPRGFFQINRKMILHIGSIQKIHAWFNHRLKIDLDPATEVEVVVARDRVNAFKSWLDQ